MLTWLNQVMHGWANYFRHAIAKNVFAMLDNFAWWRVIRMLMTRHRWRWKDVRRQYTTASGRWLPVTAGEIEMRPIAAVPVTRYRYRGSKIPGPGRLNQPDGSNRGEPVALRGARRVRREVRGDGPEQSRNRAPGLLSGTITRVLLSAGLLVLGRVDPGCAWQFRRGWRFADEAFGVGVVGGVQDLGAVGPDGCGLAVVDVGGGVQAEPAVMMLVVVPGEEVLAVRPGGFDRGEPGGEARAGISAS